MSYNIIMINTDIISINVVFQGKDRKSHKHHLMHVCMHKDVLHKIGQKHYFSYNPRSAAIHRCLLLIEELKGHTMEATIHVSFKSLTVALIFAFSLGI